MSLDDRTTNPPPWPDIWSGHQYLAFSGLDGPTHWEDSLTASLLPDRLGLRLETDSPLLLTIAWRDGEAWIPLTPADLEPCRLAHDRALVRARCGPARLAVDFALVADRRLEVRLQNDGREPCEALLALDGDGWRRDGDGYEAAGQTVRLAQDPASREVPEGDGVWRGRWRLAGGEPPALVSIVLDEPATTPVRRVALSLLPTYEPRRLAPPLARVAAKAESILRGCVMGAEGPLRRHWTVSQRVRHRALNALHVPFVAQAADHFDPTLGDDLLCGLLEQQGARGLLPSRVWPRGRTEVCAPPLVCWAVWKRHQAGRGGPLEPLVPALRAYVKHPLGARMLCRHGYARSRGARLLSWGHGEGSGMENSPRFEPGEPFAAVELNAYAAAELHTFSHILAAAAPDSREAKHYAWLAEELTNETRSYFWDEARGLFVDRYPDDDPVPAHTVASLLPLFAGVADAGQAARLVSEHLTSSDGFWTPLPVASLAADDARFDQNAWRGAVWPGINLLLIEGLTRYGYGETAAALRQRTIDELVRWYEATGTLWEFYDAGAKRSPADLPRGRRTGALPEYAWTAAAFLLLCEGGA